MLKTFIKKFLKEIKIKNFEESLLNFRKIISIIDKVANKKIIHKNKAKRYKIKLSNFFKNQKNLNNKIKNFETNKIN